MPTLANPPPFWQPRPDDFQPPADQPTYAHLNKSGPPPWAKPYQRGHSAHSGSGGDHTGCEQYGPPAGTQTSQAYPPSRPPAQYRNADSTQYRDAPRGSVSGDTPSPHPSTPDDAHSNHSHSSHGTNNDPRGRGRGRGRGGGRGRGRGQPGGESPTTPHSATGEFPGGTTNSPQALDPRAAGFTPTQASGDVDINRYMPHRPPGLRSPPRGTFGPGSGVIVDGESASALRAQWAEDITKWSRDPNAESDWGVAHAETAPVVEDVRRAPTSTRAGDGVEPGFAGPRLGSEAFKTKTKSLEQAPTGSIQTSTVLVDVGTASEVPENPQVRLLGRAPPAEPQARSPDRTQRSTPAPEGARPAPTATPLLVDTDVALPTGLRASTSTEGASEFIPQGATHPADRAGSRAPAFPLEPTSTTRELPAAASSDAESDSPLGTQTPDYGTLASFTVLTPTPLSFTPSASSASAPASRASEGGSTITDSSEETFGFATSSESERLLRTPRRFLAAPESSMGSVAQRLRDAKIDRLETRLEVLAADMEVLRLELAHLRAEGRDVSP